MKKEGDEERGNEEVQEVKREELWKMFYSSQAQCRS